MDRDRDCVCNDSPEDESGAIDEAEDRFVFEEIDEILADANATDEIPTKPPPPVDGASMEPDPKPDGYYAGGLALTNFDRMRTPDPQMALMLEKIRVGLKTYVSPAVLSQMKFDQKYDPVTDKIMMELGMYLFSNKIHTETTKEDFPAGWFQGFKQSFFPGWLQHKFPVKYTQVFKEVKTIHICPHLNYHTRSDEKFHLQFLMPEGDLTRHSA